MYAQQDLSTYTQARPLEDISLLTIINTQCGSCTVIAFLQNSYVNAKLVCKKLNLISIQKVKSIIKIVRTSETYLLYFIYFAILRIVKT